LQTHQVGHSELWLTFGQKDNKRGDAVLALHDFKQAAILKI